MGGEQSFSFSIGAEAQKLVSVQQTGRTIQINVRLASDVVYDEATTEIRNAIDPKLRTEDRELIIERKQPLIPGWDLLTFSRHRRF